MRESNQICNISELIIALEYKKTSMERLALAQEYKTLIKMLDLEDILDTIIDTDDSENKTFWQALLDFVQRYLEDKDAALIPKPIVELLKPPDHRDAREILDAQIDAARSPYLGLFTSRSIKEPEQQASVLNL